MKTLSFSKDRVRVLVSTELDSVFGGQAAAEPTATAVGGAAQPTATAVGTFNGGGVAQPTATAVTAKPVQHKHRHGVSSKLPNGNVSSKAPQNDSSALPDFDFA